MLYYNSDSFYAILLSPQAAAIYVLKTLPHALAFSGLSLLAPAMVHAQVLDSSPQQTGQRCELQEGKQSAAAADSEVTTDPAAQDRSVTTPRPLPSSSTTRKPGASVDAVVFKAPPGLSRSHPAAAAAADAISCGADSASFPSMERSEGNSPFS